MRITRDQLKEGIRFTLLNFATPIAFYGVFNVAGAKPAIALAIGTTLVQIVAHIRARQRPSPFFIVSSGFTTGFGTIDLFLVEPRYYRFEAFAQNFIIGMIFVISVLRGRPIISWFARALPERVRPKLDDTSHRYLRGVTVSWALYFFGKAFLFLYLALKVDLGRLVLLRTIIGGGSFGVMVGGEYLYRRLFRTRRPG